MKERWLAEEGKDGRCTAGKGTVKERGRLILHLRIGIILRKYTSKRMEG
jgi:hypothetical protein